MNINSKARLDQILWELDAPKSQRDAAYLAYARGKENDLLEALGMSLPTLEELARNQTMRRRSNTEPNR